MRTWRWGDGAADTVLLHLTDEEALPSGEKTAETVAALSGGARFLWVSAAAGDWNDAFSPWPAPPGFGDEPFGGRAEETLSRLLSETVPELSAGGEKRVLLAEILEDVLDDGVRHDLIIQKAVIDLLRVLLLASVDKGLVVLGLLGGQLAEVALSEDTDVAVRGLEVRLYGRRDRLSEFVKGRLNDVLARAFFEGLLELRRGLPDHCVLSKHFSFSFA